MSLTKFKDAEDLYNVSLPQDTTVVIRVDGKNFTNLLKKFSPTDSGHDEAMTLAAMETAKQMSNFIIAHVQSDEISFILSTDGFPGTQPYYGNRLQKLVSVPAGMVSAYYSILMSAYKEKMFIGTFDAKVFEIKKEHIGHYIRSRIKSGYNNCIAKLYNIEVGSMAFKSLPEMEMALTKLGIDISDRSKFGVLILKKGKIFNRIIPSEILDEISSIVDNVFDEMVEKKLGRIFDKCGPEKN